MLRYNGGVASWDNALFATSGSSLFWATPTAGGAPSMRAVAATDIPTLNQNTTGSAAKLTTARNIGVGATTKSFDGSVNIGWTLSEIGAFPSAGVIDGSSAASGIIGETISSNVAQAGALAVVWGTPRVISSVTLTAGVWTVSATLCLTSNLSGVRGYLATASGNPNNGTEVYLANASGLISGAIAPKTFNVTSTTTINLYAEMSSNSTAPSGWGSIVARRFR